MLSRNSIKTLSFLNLSRLGVSAGTRQAISRARHSRGNLTNEHISEVIAAMLEVSVKIESFVKENQTGGKNELPQRVEAD